MGQSLKNDKNQLKIVILAAGEGTRMRSSLPKVLQPLGGKPLLLRVIETAKALAPDEVVVVVGHKKEEVINALPPEVKWVTQERQLGTGHALKTALPELSASGRTLVLYGDVPLISAKTLKALLDRAPGEDAVAILTANLSDPFGYGRIKRDEQGRVLAIVEEKDASDAEKKIREINSGIYVLPNRHLTSWLNGLDNHNAGGAYYLTDVIALARSQGIAVATLSVEDHDEIAGVNDKRQLAHLERAYQRQIALNWMKAGVTLADPNRFDCRGECELGKDVVVDIDVIFAGKNSIGNQVEIGAHSYLENVVIHDGVKIAPFCHLVDCEIDSGSQVGPYARLRPGAHLAASSRVGNFVEIKNSRIGAGSKVNHLTYIGDATVGDSVNVGAGTVTCNYDGVNKYKTVIEENSFIGSGTLFVAPVTVEKGATIGAGSVITKTCPADKLTVARAKQVTVNNWVRPGRRKQDKPKE